MDNAVVIGGGIGGLSIAARLLHDGFNVKLYEKTSSLGGKINVLKEKDFTFDLTASLLMIPKDYIEIFRYCGKNYKDYFTITPIKDLYNVFYHDKTNYTFSTNLPSLCSTLKKITNNNIQEQSSYFEFLSYTYNKYLTAEKYFLNRPFLKSYNLVNPYTLTKAYNLHTLSSCYKDCKKYLSNDKLIDYLMFQSMYIGVSPYSSPNIYNLIPTATQLNGLFYIKGGMYSYVKALKNLVLDLGGEINLSSCVDEILFNKDIAIGIKVNNENIYTDKVICSSDYCYSINNLIKNDLIKSSIKTVDNFEHSCSTFILYLAVDKKYPSLNLHNIYINKNFRNNLEAAFVGVIPKDPSLYIYCPSSIDSSLCPVGCETINIIVRVPNLNYKNITWDKTNINKLEIKLLNILSSIPGLEDIKSHIIFKKHLTPVDLKDDYNSYAGSAFGISHHLNQSLIFRPQYTLPNIKNLYFTGASVHPGNGTSMVLKSSKICSNMIKKQ